MPGATDHRRNGLRSRLSAIDRRLCRGSLHRARGGRIRPQRHARDAAEFLRGRRRSHCGRGAGRACRGGSSTRRSSLGLSRAMGSKWRRKRRGPVNAGLGRPAAQRDLLIQGEDAEAFATEGFRLAGSRPCTFLLYARRFVFNALGALCAQPRRDLRRKRRQGPSGTGYSDKFESIYHFLKVNKLLALDRASGRKTPKHVKLPSYARIRRLFHRSRAFQQRLPRAMSSLSRFMPGRK